MAQTSFEHNIFILTHPEKVQAFLRTLDKHKQIHPLIVDIRHTNTHTTSEGATIRHYIIKDRMKLGPLLLTFSYRVQMSVNAQGLIVSDAYQFPAIFLHNTMCCLPEGSGTRLKEHVEITAPRLLVKTVYKQALSSHKQMFENLKEILSSQ